MSGALTAQSHLMRGAIHARLLGRAHQIAARLQTRAEAAEDAVSTTVQSVGTTVEVSLRTRGALPEIKGTLSDEHEQLDLPPIEEANR